MAAFEWPKAHSMDEVTPQRSLLCRAPSTCCSHVINKDADGVPTDQL